MVFPRHLPEVYYTTLQDDDSGLTSIQAEVDALRDLLENNTGGGLEVTDINGEGGQTEILSFGYGFTVENSGGQSDINLYNYEYQGDNTSEEVDDSTTIRFVGSEITRDSNGLVITPSATSTPSGRRGEIFYSIFKDSSDPNKLYMGTTYLIADYQEFINEANNVDNLIATIVIFDPDGVSFTIGGLENFIRGTSNDFEVGTKAEDTTAPNGLQLSAAQNSAIFFNQVSGGSNTLYGNQTNGQVPAHSHTITGDAETAPKHTFLYVGIYAN